MRLTKTFLKWRATVTPTTTHFSNNPSASGRITIRSPMNYLLQLRIVMLATPAKVATAQRIFSLHPEFACPSFLSLAFISILPTTTSSSLGLFLDCCELFQFCISIDDHRGRIALVPSCRYHLENLERSRHRISNT